MKVLLNSLPRSGTKWLYSNLTQYFNTSNIGYYLLHDLLQKPKNKQLFESISSNQSKTPQFSNEIDQRLDQLISYNLDLLISLHPLNTQSIIAIEKLRQHFNIHYTLSRKDIVEQVLSIVIAQAVGIFEPGENLDAAIEDKLVDPIFIDYQKIKYMYNYVIKTNLYFNQQPKTKHLYFEDLIGIKNSYEFCDYLDLPRKDFDLDFHFNVEYGNNKKKIVENYDEIKKYTQVLDKYKII